ncbi:RDD family protein [Mangrovicoccus algicola]|uniref:RDD family protein n=1 Tax=Mangrovicoccus algicola TaxID=2771008 RepID=A0A8J6Z0I9_9RHOB|nr:RDD family protein [Mangrovicoccus algicola]MBE3640339.1 RDD family protein [Mangrovicoccus algicola]
MHTNPYWGLPDPETGRAFYDGVLRRRFLAWLVDLVLITGLVMLAIPLTAFTGLFFLPVLWLAVSFLYRWATLSRSGATWGMRFAGIELRNQDGTQPGATIAAAHAGAYLAMTMVFPAQLISIAVMCASRRGQGLHDLILGTAMINRAQI